MNERIKKLAEQARKKPMGNSWCYTNPEEFEQKFSELIVRECAQQCWTVSELESKGFVVSECAKKIRKHFGVEE